MCDIIWDIICDIIYDIIYDIIFIQKQKLSIVAASLLISYKTAVGYQSLFSNNALTILTFVNIFITSNEIEKNLFFFNSSQNLEILVMVCDDMS